MSDSNFIFAPMEQGVTDKRSLELILRDQKAEIEGRRAEKLCSRHFSRLIAVAICEMKYCDGEYEIDKAYDCHPPTA